MTYPGNAYLPGMAEAAADAETAALEQSVSELESAGFSPRVVSAGSTPTMRFAANGVVTEYRPGTYVFGDCQQVALGSLPADRVAAGVVSTVISVHHDRIVLDAGGKAVGRNSPYWLAGYGRVGSPNGDVITRLFDHHAVCDEPVHEYSLGDRVLVVPNDINAAVNLHAWLHWVVEGELERLEVQRDGD